MIFNATISFFDEDHPSDVEHNGLFIVCDTFDEAVSHITDYYGEEYINSINIKCISPDSMIIFDEKNEQLYEEVANLIEDNVIW